MKATRALGCDDHFDKGSEWRAKRRTSGLCVAGLQISWMRRGMVDKKEIV